MSKLTLRRGDHNDAVEELQALLNKVGALLKPDSDFGSGTERAVKEAQDLAGQAQTGVADEPLWTWLAAQPDPSPDLPTEVVVFIVAEEIGGRAFYEKVACLPQFPGASSGVTIGVGYDLRFNTRADFDQDWGAELPAAQMELLRPHLGKPGTQQAVEGLRSIRVPFGAAWRVFLRTSLPKFIGKTRQTFPGYDGLSGLRRGILVSLVYNRGESMSGDDSRTEMRAIRDLVSAGRADDVPAQIQAMKRLWPPTSGLQGRRDREAALWRKGG